MCLDPLRVQTFTVYEIECFFFLFGNTQTELYDEYKQVMYGPNDSPPTSQKSDSEAEIYRPCSKQNTPAGFDSSSEDDALNAQIASRRQQLGIFDKSKVCKSIFAESDSESDKEPQHSTRSSAAKKSGKAPSAPRATRSKKFLSRVRSPSCSSHTDEQVSSYKPKAKKTKLQKLAQPKTKKNKKGSSSNCITFY